MTNATGLQDAYHASLMEFNESALARERHFHERPKPLQMREIDTVARLLGDRGTLVDIGTGTGIVARTVHRCGHRVISIDAARTERQKGALNRLMALGVEGCFAAVGEEPTGLDDSVADVVFAGDVVEHLPHSPQPFMAEVFRLLRPGGWCVLTTPNAVRLPVRLRVLMGYGNWVPLDLLWSMGRNDGHHKEYVRDELAELLHRSGFADVTVQMIEDTLRRPQIIRSLADVRTRNRFADEAVRDGHFNAASPMEWARVAMAGVTALLPGLRSSMMGIGRKPETTRGKTP